MRSACVEKGELRTTWTEASFIGSTELSEQEFALESSEVNSSSVRM